MDLFSAEFWTALVSIIIIDLMLAGDNAIVIGMAARNLPKKNQTKVIVLGTVGAIVIRSTATIAVVWLLKIPGLLLAGGILLTWIAYKLLVDKNEEHEVKSATSMFQAVRTIIIADAVMGLDNVLAVAGAAHNSFLLVIIGLLISIPIVVLGSKVFIAIIDKYPSILYIGAGVIALTAGKMITDEPWIKHFFEEHLIIKWGLIALIVIGVALAGLQKNAAAVKSQSQQETGEQAESMEALTQTVEP